MRMPQLNQKELKRLLNYEPSTGEFRWNLSPNGCIKPGELAGTIGSTGYVHIGIQRKIYKAHRLAWLYVHGDWPKGVIDHVDRDPLNNRLVNLREASNSQNLLNTVVRKDNKSGHKGVCWCPRGKKWIAKGKVFGKTIFLGRHDDLELAGLIADEFRNKYHGEFYKENTGMVENDA